MTEVEKIEPSIGEQIWHLLQTDPDYYDVTFSVGPKKVQVKAIKIVLMAASPVLKQEFGENWEILLCKGEIIPLPDLDPTAFQLFVKLLILDTWSTESLKLLNLAPATAFYLLGICRRFKVSKGNNSLEEAAKKFISSFNYFKGTSEFLSMSRMNLETVISCDDLQMNELEVFEISLRWAVSQCKAAGIATTDENLREILGDGLKEIRFPLLAPAEFSYISQTNPNILTQEEKSSISDFIALNETAKEHFDATQICFKITKRIAKQKILELTQVYHVEGQGEFVCDGRELFCDFQSSKKILLKGIGFFGPTAHYDSDYEIGVEILHIQILFKRIAHSSDNKFVQKLRGQKGKVIYFFFPEPKEIHPSNNSEFRNFFRICYWIKGPPVSMFKRWDGVKMIEAEGARFLLDGFDQNNAIAELVFELVEETEEKIRDKILTGHFLHMHLI